MLKRRNRTARQRKVWAKPWRCESRGLLGGQCRAWEEQIAGQTQGEREEQTLWLQPGSVGRGFQVGDGAAKRIQGQRGALASPPEGSGRGVWASQVFECPAGGALATRPALAQAPPHPRCSHGGDTSLSAPDTDGARMSKAVGTEAWRLWTGPSRDRCTSAELSHLLSGSTEDGGPGM